MTTTSETSPAPSGALPLPPRWYRWTVLVLISLAMFGNYYIYDSISPLADVLKQQLGFSDGDIGLLNAIYSIPNIFMVLIGGMIIDRIGVKISTLLFALLCLIGAAVTVAAPVLEVMAAGRLIFGLGAESLIVAVTTAIARWFRGKELSFAFGMNLTIARIGSFAALNSPGWASSLYSDWRLPLLVSVGAGVVCVAGAVIYWGLEATAAKRYDLGAGGAQDKVVLSELLRFGTSYWAIVALCVVFYSAVFPFQTFAVKFFMEAHGTTREHGGFLSSILTLFAMIATPLFGLAADRFGRRATLMVWGSFLMIPAYLLMAYTSVSLYVPMALMGTAFSLIPAVMWPSVAYIVGQERLGTAYGLMTMVQNIGLAGFNLAIGWANDAWGASAANPGGYVPGMWIFTGLGIMGVLMSLFLLRHERGPGAHGLESITTQSR
jgi:MFS family permease